MRLDRALKLANEALRKQQAYLDIAHMAGNKKSLDSVKEIQEAQDKIRELLIVLKEI